MFCQYQLDQPTLSKNRMVYHHTMPHLVLSNEWEDDRPDSQFALDVPLETRPINTAKTSHFWEIIIKKKTKMKNKSNHCTVWQGGQTTSLICATADATSASPMSSNSINSNSVRDNASCDFTKTKKRGKKIIIKHHYSLANPKENLIKTDMKRAKRIIEINESATQRREACLEYWTQRS